MTIARTARHLASPNDAGAVTGRFPVALATVRYAQGGGLTDAGRAAWERIRLPAVERFDGGHPRAGPEPAGGSWSLVERDIGNPAAADLSQITRTVKHRLKQIRYRPELVDGCFVGPGLIMGG
ncbi:hypothetical protein [Streptomyces sp. NPDC020362]|uniref:hypothetical protein n=1 Tax=unclassified Streptomyces TaxID=2593676 RepID=UPI0033E666E1